MTPTHEPHNPTERDDLSPEALAEVDTWFAQQHQDMGVDLTDILDLNTGLHEILLAGRHRDTGVDLAGMLDLNAGLAAILPAATEGGAASTPLNNLDDLLGRVEAAPAARLINRDQLQELASDIDILNALQHAAGTGNVRVRARDLDRALNRERVRTRERLLAELRDHALDLDRAVARALDHDYSRDGDLVAAFTSARTRALSLAEALNDSRTLVFARAQDMVLDRSIALAQARARDLALALACARDLARDLDLGLNDKVRARILTLAPALSSTMCEAAVRSEVGILIRMISQEPSADTSWLNLTIIDAVVPGRLRDLADDFIAADLRRVNLTGLDLIGVRWSRTTTRWPDADEEWILAASEPGPCGIYIIRAAPAPGGLMVAPSPTPVEV
jgi:hypothetical protein